MTKARLLAAIGMMGLLTGISGCADQDLRKYLGENGRLTKYLMKLDRAICQLEAKNPAGLNPMKRICPNGDGDPITTPHYPPAQ